MIANAPCDRAKIVEAYARFLTTNASSRHAVVLLGALAFVIIVAKGVPLIELDFPIFSLFPEKSSPATFWQTKRKHLSTNVFQIKTGYADWPRKHPLYASIADPSRYSLISTVENAKKTNEFVDTWYHVFLQFMLP